ncbi:hypothetical protein [Kineosporia sp. R_H_3]|uniref:hypothetical protein n=1 Tax=Kineosporia sp. R_H_3 TaxID=1961848 RepID=UPI0013044A60|nr:hypothetical protein [Kineosporia sp. R_H_3]
MSVWQIIGVALVVIGVGEYVLFRYLAPRREDIARRMPLLVANSAFNVVVGAALFVLL